MSVYDQVRRMVAYVRWTEGDADEIAPSLYAARRGFRRASSGPTEPTADPTPGGPTPPVPPMDPVPGSGPALFTP